MVRIHPGPNLLHSALHFPDTHSWGRWQNRVVDLYLPLGHNTLSFHGLYKNGGPNFDYIALAPTHQSGYRLPSTPQYPFEAEKYANTHFENEPGGNSLSKFRETGYLDNENGGSIILIATHSGMWNGTPWGLESSSFLSECKTVWSARTTAGPSGSSPSGWVSAKTSTNGGIFNWWG